MSRLFFVFFFILTSSAYLLLCFVSKTNQHVTTGMTPFATGQKRNTNRETPKTLEDITMMLLLKLEVWPCAFISHIIVLILSDLMWFYFVKLEDRKIANKNTSCAWTWYSQRYRRFPCTWKHTQTAASSILDCGHFCSDGGLDALCIVKAFNVHFSSSHVDLGRSVPPALSFPWLLSFLLKKYCSCLPFTSSLDVYFALPMVSCFPAMNMQRYIKSQRRKQHAYDKMMQMSQILHWFWVETLVFATR